MVIEKRAVTEDAKLRKKEHILFTAYRCFEKESFKDLKMIDIAKEAGVAKGTLFNYFKTKEHLFLEMLFQEYEQRFFKIEKLLTAEKGTTLKAFKNFILNELDIVIKRESILFKLEAIKSVILEANLDREIKIVMDRLFREQLQDNSKKIANQFDCIRSEDIVEIFDAQKAFIIGFYHLTMKTNHTSSSEDFSKFRQRTLQSMKYYLDGYLKNGVDID